MTDNRYNGFDMEIKHLLQDAEEEVPPQIWEAVSSGVRSRRRRSMWMKRAGVAAAAAAAVAAVLTFGIPSSHDAEPSELLADNAVTAVSEPAVEETAATEETAQESVTTPSYRHAAVSAPACKSAETVRPAEDKVMEEEYASEEAPAAAEPSQTTSGARKRTAGATKKSSARDPFAMMAYEDAHKDRSRIEFDIKGLVGTNDKSTAGASHGILATSGSKNPSTAAISEDGESIYGVPLTVGAGVKVHFAPKWAVSAGIDYSLLTRTFEGKYTSPESGQFYSDNIKHSVQYIGLPVNLYFDIISSDYVSMYAFAGGTMEKGISDKYVIPTSAGDKTWKQDVPGLQWSAAAGLGVQFRLSKSMGLYADPGLRYYFDCDQPKSIRTQQPLMFSLELGLRFDL